MKKEKMFVVGDVHGQMSMLEKMLEHWQPEEEQLLFVGDLADRGEDSKAVFERVHTLMETEGAIVVKGNHDEMLEQFLENPATNLPLYYMNGGESTINSLLGRSTSRENYAKNVQEIKEEYPWLLPMLQSFPLYYEWGDYLFVHAGVNLRLDDWRASSDHDFVWIREGFYDQPNTTDKTIIFGHSVTSTLHGDMTNFDIWESGDGLIGIDGGAVYGGKMHALVLSKETIEAHYVVENDGYRF